MNVLDQSFANIESAFTFNTGAGIVVPVKGGWAVDFGFRYMQSNINFHTEKATQKVKKPRLLYRRSLRFLKKYENPASLALSDKIL